MLQQPTPHLILASQSSGRAALLEGAGLTFDKKPADLDERAIEQTLYAGGNRPDPSDVAMVLAMAKAEHVSKMEPEALVIGADQVLSLDEVIYEKPSSMAAARDNLIKFRGKTHFLHAAVCVAQGGDTIWSYGENAAMTLRDFSNEFLGDYLAAAGESVMTSVGAYRLEGVGIHLFEKIDGDYFTILGLPILPLLDFLRREKLLNT
jgi:septum formation protein